MNPFGVQGFVGNTAEPQRFAPATATTTQTQRSISNAVAEARSETTENIGFMLGERIKAQEKEEKKPKVNLRDALYRIAESLPIGNDMERLFSQLEEAMAKFSNKASLKQHLLNIFRDKGLAALVLQMYLKKKKKKVLSDILGELVDEFGGDSSIVLFSALQFGSGNEEAKRKINKLYHETAQQFTGISSFYQKLKQQIKDRQKIKKVLISMLHSYAEDLHDASEGLFKIKVSFVIKELRRLETVLSMDYMCEDIAKFMSSLRERHIKNITGEKILDLVVEWLDVSWIYDAMIHEKITSLYIASISSQVLFLQKIRALFKLLPKLSYDSEEGRSHILDILQEEINKTSNAEEYLQ